MIEVPAEAPQRIRFGSLIHGMPRPLAMSSLPTLDARVAEILARAEAVRGLKPSTIRWARHAYNSLRKFLVERRAERDFLAGDLPRQVDVLQRWVGWMRSKDVRTVAVNTHWRGAASIFRWLAEEDGVLSPFGVIEAPRFARLTPAFLPRQDAARLLTAIRNQQWAVPLARHRNLAIVGMMMLAGLRRGEVLRMHVADIDLANRRIRVLGAKGMHGGKDRTSWMSPQLATILADYLAARKTAEPRRTHAELITHLTRNAAVGVGTMQHLFAALSRLIGSRVTPHMLRHTYATLLRQAGVADRVSMELLGHGSLAMLQRYSHIENGEARRAAEMLDLNVEL